MLVFRKSKTRKAIDRALGLLAAMESGQLELNGYIVGAKERVQKVEGALRTAQKYLLELQSYEATMREGLIAARGFVQEMNLRLKGEGNG